jgi:hypothetical protein
METVSQKIGGQATVLSTGTQNHVIGEVSLGIHVFKKLEAKFNQEFTVTFTPSI